MTKVQIVAYTGLAFKLEFACQTFAVTEIAGTRVEYKFCLPRAPKLISLLWLVGPGRFNESSIRMTDPSWILSFKFIRAFSIAKKTLTYSFVTLTWKASQYRRDGTAKNIINRRLWINVTRTPR